MPQAGMLRTSKAPRPVRRAFFVACLIALPGAPAGQTPFNGCAPDRIDAQVQVRHVSDGDTLILDNGSRIRLIGLDTPELGRDGGAHAPFAVRARDHLRLLLFRHGQRLGLRYDSERRDHYGRTLAHAFLPDGTSVSANMLSAGLGSLMIIPPNTWNLDCYRHQADQARSDQRGLWAHPAYRVQRSDQLPLDTQGFTRVRGRIVRVAQGGGATLINLQGRFALRIADEDLKHFGEKPSSAWIGRDVEAEGRVYQRKGELRIRLRHPSAMRLLP